MKVGSKVNNLVILLHRRAAVSLWPPAGPLHIPSIRCQVRLRHLRHRSPRPTALSLNQISLSSYTDNLSAMPQSDGDSNSNPILNPIKAERPLLKKSRTIADDSRTPHFPGPLFPTVRRISTSTPSSHRSFDPDTTSPNTDPFGTQGDRDWMFPSFLGPHTSRRRVIVQSSKSQKQELSPRSPAPPPARSASMPANCGHSIKRSTNCSRALVPNTNILESAGLRSDSRTPRRAIPRVR
ncbi:hypothetical protein CsSME_00042523 [Camellia sinensis var. sinensis]